MACVLGGHADDALDKLAQFRDSFAAFRGQFREFRGSFAQFRGVSRAYAGLRSINARRARTVSRSFVQFRRRFLSGRLPP